MLKPQQQNGSCRAYITPVDEALIPTGDFEAVAGTVFDLNNSTLLNDTVTKVSLCKFAVHSLDLVATSSRTLL